MDLQNPASQWSYHRMAYTENFIIFWEKGFGNDLSNPPQLEGHSMKVNLPNLKEKLESFYTYFYHTLQFAKQGSKCDKYRMMVMINYSLEGTGLRRGLRRTDRCALDHPQPGTGREIELYRA